MSSKKINLISATAIAISSMLGMGIFIKTERISHLAHYQNWPIFFILLLGFLIIFFFLKILLLLNSNQITDQGFLEWTKKYCPKCFNKFSIYFVKYIYYPFSLIVISIFLLEKLNIYKQTDIFVIGFLTLLISLLFLTINFFSFKFASKLQMYFLLIVIVGLIILPIIAINDYMQSSVIEITEQTTKNLPTGLSGISPWMLLLSGFPSIFFMYDGFYCSLSLRKILKNPQKINVCLKISFIFLTILYAFIIFSFKIAAPQSGKFEDFPTIKKYSVLKEFFTIIICVAGFLTINVSAMSNLRQLNSLNEEYKFNDIKLLTNFLRINNKKNNFLNPKFINLIYLSLTTMIWIFLIFSLAFFSELVSGETNSIFIINESIADLISSIIFGIISIIIFSLIKTFNFKNKKTNFKYKIISYLVSFCILFAIIYSYVNDFVGIIGVNGSNSYLSIIKLMISSIFIIIWVIKFLKNYFLKLQNKNYFINLNFYKKEEFFLTYKLNNQK